MIRVKTERMIENTMRKMIDIKKEVNNSDDIIKTIIEADMSDNDKRGKKEVKRNTIEIVVPKTRNKEAGAETRKRKNNSNIDSRVFFNYFSIFFKFLSIGIYPIFMCQFLNSKYFIIFSFLY